MSILDAPATIKSINNLNQKIYASDSWGGQQSTNRMPFPQASTVTNNIVVCSINARKMVNGGSTMRFLYTNTSGLGEAKPPSSIHIHAAIEYPIGQILPLTFSGSSVATITPNGSVLSDPIGIAVLQGETLYERVTAHPPMPPFISVAGSTTGGILAANTYFYKVTCVTNGGESNASAEVTVTNTGSTSSNTLSIGDANMRGVDVLYYNIYRSTTTNTEVLIGSTSNAKSLQFIDTGNDIPTASTTLTSGATAAYKFTVGSTVGLKASDIVSIGAAGNFIIQLVTSLTTFEIASTTAVTQSSGVTVAKIVTPPSTVNFINGYLVLNSNLDAHEGTANGHDFTYGDTNLVYTATVTNQTYAADAILSQPASSVTTLAPTIVGLGDSIMRGKGWESLLYPYQGFFAYALNEQFPYLNLGVFSETVQAIANLSTGSIRAALTQGSKYTVCEAGTNDFATRSVAQIKADMITVAKRCIDSGSLFHWQTTIIAKASSTDGWQTYVNQTANANNTNIQAINQWLRAPVSAGAGNSMAYDIGTSYTSKFGVFDTSLLVETNASGTALTINPADGSSTNGPGGFWKIFDGTHYAVNTGTISGTTTSLTDSGQAWTVNQWNGYMLSVTTSGVTQYVEIRSNTATQLLVDSGFTINAPNSGTTYFIYKSPTQDGTHPTDFTAIMMAGAINTSLFV